METGVGAQKRSRACAEAMGQRKARRHSKLSFHSARLHLHLQRHAPPLSPRAFPLPFHRIERLLTEELSPPLPFAMERRLECSSRDCWLKINTGCIVIAMSDLFEWLLETRSFESYVVTIPPRSTELYERPDEPRDVE